MDHLVRPPHDEPHHGVAVGAYGSMAARGRGLPAPGGELGCQPGQAIDPALIQQPGSVYQECFVPLGISFGVDQAGNVYPKSQIGLPVAGPGLTPAPGFQLFPRNGMLWIYGVRFFTDVGFVEIDSVVTGDSDWNHLLGPVDPATWNMDECFCPVNWGCISITNPLRIAAHTIDGIVTTVQAVRGTVWGNRRATVGACGPNIPGVR